MKWNDDLDEDSPIKAKIAPLIQWLEEASEESDSEDSE